MKGRIPKDETTGTVSVATKWSSEQVTQHWGKRNVLEIRFEMFKYFPRTRGFGDSERHSHHHRPSNSQRSDVVALLCGVGVDGGQTVAPFGLKF